MAKFGSIGFISLATVCFVEAAFGGSPRENPTVRAGSPKGTTADAATRIVELEATLVSPLATKYAYFGQSVAISGNRIVVGASGADTICQPGCTIGPGAAYVYRRQGQQWVLEKKLVASDRVNGNAFGFSVAIDGDTIVVGAPQVSVGNNSQIGAIYVFQRDGSDWHEVVKRLHPQGVSGRLGAAVAISGDIIVAGAPDYQSGAFVFGRSLGWALEATLVPWDGNNPYFGAAVSISGSTVVVSGPFGDAPGTPDSGAAYLFRKSLGTWVRDAKIVPDLPISYAEFGHSVSMFGDSLLVGALSEKTLCQPNVCNPGAAYQFQRTGTSTWTQIRRFEYPKDYPSGYNPYFGVSVALSSDLALVGAHQDDEPECPAGNCNQGAAYSFLRSGTGWMSLARLSSPHPDNESGYGTALAATDTTFVVGASSDDFVAQDGGAVYVYRVFVDCNGNGTPDELETDCNNNDIPDDCDITGGSSEDCNANAVPDECDLSIETSTDCNGNEVPDECDTLYAKFQSADLTPIGVQAPRTFPIPNPPLSGGNVTLTLKVRGDFGSPAEALEVRMNGTLVGTAFGVGGSDCPVVADTEQLIVPKAAFNQAARTGHADFQMVGTSSVDPAPPGCTSSVNLKVEYQAVTEGDCNGNGNPDSCDVSDLVTPDCNENGIPDECDLSSGFSEDCNGNAVPDECESSTLYMAVSTIPPSGAIDARQDRSPIVLQQGIDRLRILFACQPFDTASGQPLTPSSFSVTATAGAVPEVVAFTQDSQNPFSYELVLSKPIPAGAWTTLSVDPTNQNGAAVGAGTMISLGFLPGDVNGDGTSAPADILNLVDNLNRVRVPALNEWQCDLDRSGLCSPPDVIREIDLLNGVYTSRPWNGVRLPSHP